MKKILLIVSFFVCALRSNAEDISTADIGSYSLLQKDDQPTGMQLRLTQLNQNWRMEGKRSPEAGWEDISCDAGCNYRKSTPAEIEKYLAIFPIEARIYLSMSCIQNVASAFCRVNSKIDPAKTLYLLVGLIGEKPAPMLLQRLG